MRADRFLRFPVILAATAVLLSGAPVTPDATAADRACHDYGTSLRWVAETWLDFNPANKTLPEMSTLPGPVHNLRYSQNPNIMFWRHLVVQAYVSKLGDSVPDPRHFEDKWLNWTPATRNIEMALKWSHTVPKAEPYDVDELPEVIRRDLRALKAKTSNDVWRGYPPCE